METIVHEPTLEEAARIMVDLVDHDANDLDERTRVELQTFRAFASEYFLPSYICKSCHG